MMNTPLFSVIVPVYNVEKYLSTCIDSILMQTMKDYEVILVDDGSKDSCGVICDDYAEKYERVHAFHKENGGLSDARNFGISKACGEYLLFIDSDDYYDDCEFFKKIEKAVYEYDYPTIINFSYKKYFEPDNMFYKCDYLSDVNTVNDIDSYEKQLDYLVKNDLLAISAWLKAIRRSFVVEKKIFFKVGIYSEDIEWSMRVYTEDLNMKFIDSDAYVYRNGRVGSITNSMKKKNLIDLFNIIDEYSKKFLNSEDLKSQTLMNYLAYQYCILCGLVVRIKDKEEKKQIFALLKKTQWIFKYSSSAKVKKVSLVYRIFGLKNTVFLLNSYIKYRRG